MTQNKPPALLAGALLAGLTAASAQAAAAGHIANQLTDTLLVAPLKQADTVWDVFQVMNSWLGETFPEKGDARTAIDAFDKFIAKYNTDDAAVLRVPRTVEMPLSVDRYLRILRKNAPGVNGPMSEKAAGNVKAQLATAALLPFLQLRGIAYRLRPLVSQSYMLHNLAVNNLRHLKQDLRVRAGNNGLAVFEFLTYPMAERKGELIQFARFSELQRWISRDLIPTLDVSLEMGEKALAQMTPGQKESLDLTVFMLADNPFPDASKEMGHRYFSTAEVKAFLGRTYRLRAALRLFTAYNLDELPLVSNKLRDVFTKQFLMEKIPFGQARKKVRTGSPPVVRYRVISRFGKFLTLRDGAQGPLALEDLRKAWTHTNAALDEYYAAGEGGPARVVNLDWIQATQKDFKTKVAPQISAALAGPASLTDYVGGTTVDIDLPGTLSSLPADLKNFFPSEYVEKDSFWEFEFSSGKLAYTNYDFGTPVGWDKAKANDSWGKLFPNIRKELNDRGHWDGPLWIFRDVGRTYVGGIISPLLSAVIY